MTESIHGFSPVFIPGEDDNWHDSQPLLMKIASVGNRLLPRGKGAVPRWIGRKFGARWKTTIRTDSGCRLAVDPGNLDLYVTIQNTGAWEPWVRKACLHSLADGEVFFDIGANAGTISNEVGLARRHSVVKAFEPQPKLSELVAVSARLNGLTNIDVFPVAVGDHDGVIMLHVPAHALHASTMALGESGELKISCPLISLDRTVGSNALPPPNVIKVDVEGGELAVLTGAKEILCRHSPIVIFEVNDNCERFGYVRDDILSLLKSCASYQFFRIAPGDILAAPADKSVAFEKLYSRI